MSSSASATLAASGYKGTERLLWGIVLAVVTFWLFAGTMGTIAVTVRNEINSGGEVISVDAMNLSVAITALFSGLFIVLMGRVADKTGRVRVALLGCVSNVVGSLLIVFAAGGLAVPLLLAGRAIQGFSAACIMPSTMALVKTYWDGAGRQRAVSMWSIGSWGGSGLAAVFGGYMATLIGWQWIFIIGTAISIIAILMILGTPESKAPPAATKQRFDVLGFAIFIITMLALLIVLTFGSSLGWTSPTALVLGGIAIVGIIAFVVVERRVDNPFIDFRLFANGTFTGATISNFLLNATIGMLIVSQQLLQIAGGMTASEAGLLTLGYAITIIAFIRVGEKLLQRFGPRKPMIWGSLIVGVAILLLVPTNLLLAEYRILAVVAYSLFGLGLAFYATPSTDAALSNLPGPQAGAGSGIYKMASSLGSSIGAAVTLVLFTSFSSGPVQWIGTILVNQGRQDNIAFRQAGFIALLFNLLIVALAIISIMLTVPKGKETEIEKAAPAPAPDQAGPAT